MVLFTGPLTESKAYVKINSKNDKIYIHVILNLAYHVAFNNDIHMKPSISEHQLLIVGMTKNLFEVHTVVFI